MHLNLGRYEWAGEGPRHSRGGALAPEVRVQPLHRSAGAERGKTSSRKARAAGVVGSVAAEVQYVKPGGKMGGGLRPEARRPAGLSMTAGIGKASAPALISAQYTWRSPCIHERHASSKQVKGMELCRQVISQGKDVHQHRNISLVFAIPAWAAASQAVGWQMSAGGWTVTGRVCIYASGMLRVPLHAVGRAASCTCRCLCLDFLCGTPETQESECPTLLP